MSVARELADLVSASPSTDANFDDGTLVVDVSTDRVGIGTTAPLNQLHIDSGTSANASDKFYDLVKLKGKNNTRNAVGLNFSVESTAGGAGVDYAKGALVYDLAGGSWGRGKFHFLQEGAADTADADIANAVMTVDNDGKVGIGTVTPVTDLTIEGPITIKEQASADADTAAYGQIWVNNAAPNGLVFTNDAGNDITITEGTGLSMTIGKAIAMSIVFSG